MHAQRGRLQLHGRGDLYASGQLQRPGQLPAYERGPGEYTDGDRQECRGITAQDQYEDA